MGTKRGIFCIETSHWNHGSARQPSVEKLLELIESTQGIPYVHRDFSTKEELDFLLTQATQKTNAVKFPVIYLASHGGQRRIEVHRKAKTNLKPKDLDLGELGELLRDRGNGRVFFVSACGLMRGHAAHLKTFLKVTGFEALFGYQIDVPWIESAQLELGLLPQLAQCTSWHKSTMKAAIKKISHANRSLIKALQLRSVPDLLS